MRKQAQALGVAYQEANITDGHYRWGSCTPNGNLNFNWRLIKAPLFVIDYVIAHELAHLIEPNHNAALLEYRPGRGGAYGQGEGLAQAKRAVA